MALDKMLNLQQRIGYRFNDAALLQRALTHRSASAEHMERLEFLGDAVLELVITEHLYRQHPRVDEGGLSRMRASVVCRDGLLQVADAWSLQDAIAVGSGERGASGIKSPSIVANAVEAVIGAVFIDGGWEEARRLVLRAWRPLLARLDEIDLRDAKSRLQEWTQARGWGVPEYQVVDLGAGRHPRFQARCSVQGRMLGSGMGARKKQAEAKAAEQAWLRLRDEQAEQDG